MHEDPLASPWSCSLSLDRSITHNCLTPFRHGHSVELGLSSFTHHTPPCGVMCVSVTAFLVPTQCASPYMDRI